MSCWMNDFEHTGLTSRFEVQRSNVKMKYYISTAKESHQT